MMERRRFLMFAEYFVRRVFHFIFGYHVLIGQGKIVVFEFVLIESWPFDWGWNMGRVEIGIFWISGRHHWFFLQIFIVLQRRGKSWGLRLLIIKRSNRDGRRHRFFLHEFPYFMSLHGKLFAASQRLIFSTWLFSTINRPVLFLSNPLVFFDDIFSIKFIEIHHEVTHFVFTMLFLEIQLAGYLSGKFGDVGQEKFVLCFFLFDLRRKYVMGFKFIVFEKWKIQLKIVHVVHWFPLQLAWTDRFQEPRAVYGDILLVFLAIWVIAGPLLNQILFHSLEPLEENRLSSGQNHEGVLISQQNSVAIKFCVKHFLQARRLILSKI